MNKQCPKCGTLVSDNSNYCYNCGCDLTRPPYQSQTPPPFAGNSPQPVSGNNNAFDASGPEGKCRGIAAILAIVIGSLGIHYFYMNKVAAGVITILLTIVTCSLWSIITFVQGIYMLCITNDQFQQRYINNPSSFPVF